MTAIYFAFKNSWRGLRYGAHTERALRQELVLISLGLPLSVLLGQTLWVRVALTAALMLMLAAEYLNTAIEKLCDHLHPDRHQAIGMVKDMASAGAFLAQALAALIWVAALFDRLSTVV